MNNNFYVEGTMLVRNPVESDFLRDKDIYGNLIFISAGSISIRRENLESNIYNEDKDTILDNRPNPIEIHTGVINSWGDHMVVTIEEFSDFVNGMRYAINKFGDGAIKANDRKLYICNKIIDFASMLLSDIKSDEFHIPKSILKIREREDIIDDLRMLASLEKFNINETSIYLL